MIINIHISTNDIEGSDIRVIMIFYNNLISVIRQESNTVIVMSAIIPRPVVHQVTRDKVKNK